MRFYDTNAILRENLDNIEETIYLSSITLLELEHIKVSRNKDEEVKYNARKTTRWLKENEDKYECVVADTEVYDLVNSNNLEIDNDNLICASAVKLQNETKEEVTFITDDICCFNIAKNIFGLKCQGLTQKPIDNYKGYREIIMTDEEMAKFYETENKENIYGLEINEYLIIKNTLNQPVDAWKFNGLELEQINVKNIQSSLFGKLKAKDFWQQITLDSFQNNTITLIKGKAGSGKSFLSMSFLFDQLEKGKIDKIIIFANPIATRGACKLGYYKGTKDEKLLDSQVGNFLVSKIGDKGQVLNYISNGTIVLLPISDIRGYETSSASGVYITEAQNMSIDMMKLALQRIGDDSILIIDGDLETQVDDTLFAGDNNGMKRVSEVFRGRDCYGEVELKHIYRSKIAEIADKM